MSILCGMTLNLAFAAGGCDLPTTATATLLKRRLAGAADFTGSLVDAALLAGALAALLATFFTAAFLAGVFFGGAGVAAVVLAGASFFAATFFTATFLAAAFLATGAFLPAAAVLVVVFFLALGLLSMVLATFFFAAALLAGAFLDGDLATGFVAAADFVASAGFAAFAVFLAALLPDAGSGVFLDVLATFVADFFTATSHLSCFDSLVTGKRAVIPCPSTRSNYARTMPQVFYPLGAGPEAIASAGQGGDSLHSTFRA